MQDSVIAQMFRKFKGCDPSAACHGAKSTPGAPLDDFITLMCIDVSAPEIVIDDEETAPEETAPLHRGRRC